MHKLTLKFCVSLVTLVSFLSQALAVPMQSSSDSESDFRPRSPTFLKLVFNSKGPSDEVSEEEIQDSIQELQSSKSTQGSSSNNENPSQEKRENAAVLPLIEEIDMYGGNGFLGVGEQVIPLDVLHHIFGELPIKEQAKVGAVCKLWRKEREETSGGMLSSFTRGIYSLDILKEVQNNIRAFLTRDNFLYLLENPVVFCFLISSILEPFSVYKEGKRHLQPMLDPQITDPAIKVSDMAAIFSDEKVMGALDLAPCIRFLLMVANLPDKAKKEFSSKMKMSEDKFEWVQSVAIGLIELAGYNYSESPRFYLGIGGGEEKIYGLTLLKIKNALEVANLDEVFLFLCEEVLRKTHNHLIKGREHWLTDIWSHSFELSQLDCFTTLQGALISLVKNYCREGEFGKALSLIQKVKNAHKSCEDEDSARG